MVKRAPNQTTEAPPNSSVKNYIRVRTFVIFNIDALSIRLKGRLSLMLLEYINFLDIITITKISLDIITITKISLYNYNN